MAFEESKHPRDKNGQFTSKGNGTIGKGTSVGEDATKMYAKAFYKQSNGDRDAFIQHNINRFGIPRGSSRKKEEEYYGKQWDEQAKDEEIEKDDVWENWEEWDDYDAGKTHGYATIDDYNRANEIIDELDTINKKWKNDDRELLKTWQNKSLTDEEYNTKNDELYKKANDKKATLKKELDEITTRADKFQKQYNERKKAKDEKERKQAYKLFDLPF